MNPDIIWLGIGLLGQALFSMRFLVQWLASERRRRSVVPVAFWYFSLAGGSTLLAYAIYRADPVFIIGQLTGLFIYARNLHLIWREHKARVTETSHASS
ncbi:lipid-A-disaccharide synthase N-terminal domain-containing protein [Tepidiphilus margaritifer]|uniref:lipid-A-disaccharide synthase N-terminal domain-containing protein n=1 Tax=Tepidiphilus margaritifer TaxID=203471 RepID=UPI0004134E8A|nr:lipid-A-disaccharide synthase N-terminal domain-containing protein [Tepidiphilus margaritifer]